MLLLKHPDTGLYYRESHILAYANLTDPPMDPEDAVDELEREGYERVWPESIEWESPTLQSLGAVIVEYVGQIARNTERQDEAKVESPYLNADEAAAYLRTTVKGIYGLVENGKLEKCPGLGRLLFTREMLDDCVMGKVRKPARRRKPS